ncbi:MAG TPA: RagB/SusD family nutrient uptake outer membrane protein [Membranihabitans sp.]|nr:RagB/SusD family nutrient uptake outer membrane protein [Membranihabitans sp.]
MKSLKYKIALFAFLALGVSSCEDDFLDRLPLNEISTEDYWERASDLELYMNNFYTLFNVTGSDRYEHIFARDIQSDDMTHVQASPRLRGSRTVPESGGWDYSTIRNVNYFFENYTKCQEPFESYKAYLGEAHFFRAYLYFNLVKEYGDVPWINKPLATDSEELYMVRTPRNQVVDSIIADLDKAVEYLPSGKQLGGTRLSKEIAQLLKSRVCLYEGTWEKYHADGVFAVSNANPTKYLELAASSALAVIQSGLYSVYERGDVNWNYFFFAQVDYADNPEVMFWKKYDLDIGIGHARQFQVARGKSGGVGLTKSFVESYLCADGRPIYLSNGEMNPLYQGDDNLKATTTNRDPRMIQTFFTPGFPLQIIDGDTTRFTRPSVDEPAHTVCPTGYQINKILNFDPIHHKSLDTQSDGFTGWIIFRYAEALLNYAEAKAELGTITQADIDISIKLLRDRVGMPNLMIDQIVTDPNWDFTSLSPVINEIRRERRIELVGEGFRWDDIARWAAADELILNKRPLGGKFNSMDYPDLTAQDFNLTEGYFDPLKSQIPNGFGFRLDRDYLSPISTVELNLNPQLVQNPGW